MVSVTRKKSQATSKLNEDFNVDRPRQVVTQYEPKQMDCKNCGTNSICRRRTFSMQAWTVLLLWNEINPNSVDQAMCQDCYEEMREILIDRADEIEVAMQENKQVPAIQKKLKKLAG